MSHEEPHFSAQDLMVSDVLKANNYVFSYALSYIDDGTICPKLAVALDLHFLTVQLLF